MSYLNNINLCFRCGKQRKKVKTYTELIENSKITFTDMVCDDPDCQSKLDSMLQKDKEKREQTVLQKAKDEEMRQQNKSDY